MLRSILIISLLFLLNSCGGGLLNQGNDLNANLEATDKIYGKCNNPNRQFTKNERKICEGQVRAAGPDGKVGDPINLSDIFDRFNNPDKNVVYSASSVNQFLWNGTLNVLSNYPLKTVDSQGGFIATDWILNENIPNQRCLIKVNITSIELISTGVETNIICEKKISEEWYLSEEKFVDEKKRITLKILEKAQELSSSQLS